MKKLSYAASGLGMAALLLWTAGLAIDLVQKIHYLPMYLHQSVSTSTSLSTLTVTGPSSVANSAFVADNSTNPVPAPVDHPPLKIICGAHVFRVVYVSHDWLLRKQPPAYAMSNMEQRIIVLDRQRNAVQIREDVIHELTHIALWENGGKAMTIPDEEESYVKSIAPALRDILADNPKLVKWLMKHGG